MRPLCQSTPRAPKHADDSDHSDLGEQGPPQIVISGSTGLGIDTTAGAHESFQPRTPVRTDTKSTEQTDWTAGSAASASAKERTEHGKGKGKHRKTAKLSNIKQGKGGGTDTPTRSSDHQSKRKGSQPLTNSGHLRSPGSPGRTAW